MSIRDEITNTLIGLQAESSGTFVHGGNTYTVVKAYTSGADAQMLPEGYDQEVADLSVFLLIDDLQAPHPETGDACTLDGVEYEVWRPISKNAAAWWIPLKRAE